MINTENILGWNIHEGSFIVGIIIGAVVLGAIWGISSIVKKYLAAPKDPPTNERK